MSVHHRITGYPDPRTYNLCNQKINKLHVIGFAGYRNYQAKWLCHCECGNWTIQDAYRLKKGTAQSCGCNAGKHGAITHGDSYAPECEAYLSAKYRCQNIQHQSYPQYGGRGIEFRFTSYEQFLEHIGRRPSAEYSLDRINNNGHYEIGNVRWATRLQQARNQRRNVIITALGNSKIRSQWAAETGLGIATIRDRIKVGWCNDCAVSIPAYQGKCPHI